jgi:DNA-directed RNA polymerase specialized sigma24 family protein
VYIDTEEYATIDVPFSNEVDEFWVLGEETDALFSRLSVQERQLIKWRYIDNKRSSEIALKITEHPNTVREHITKIKEKLKVILKEPGMKDYRDLLKNFFANLEEEEEEEENSKKETKK